MLISKLAVILANEHQNDQKKIKNDFRIIFRYVCVHAKPLCQWNAKKVVSGRILTNLTAS